MLKGRAGPTWAAASRGRTSSVKRMPWTASKHTSWSTTITSRLAMPLFPMRLRSWRHRALSPLRSPSRRRHSVWLTLSRPYLLVRASSSMPRLSVRPAELMRATYASFMSLRPLLPVLRTFSPHIRRDSAFRWPGIRCSCRCRSTKRASSRVRSSPPKSYPDYGQLACEKA